jgi:hypothetical protein
MMVKVIMGVMMRVTMGVMMMLIVWWGGYVG